MRYGNVLCYFSLLPYPLTALQIAGVSQTILSFASHYHSMQQRSGLSMDSMPSLQECDDMIAHENKVRDGLQRIREVLLEQQYALADRQRAQENGFKGHGEYNGDDANLYHDDGKNTNFQGPDAKKRRGVCLVPCT
jgi:hypothetical protein